MAQQAIVIAQYLITAGHFFDNSWINVHSITQSNSTKQHSDATVIAWDVTIIINNWHWSKFVSYKGDAIRQSEFIIGKCDVTLGHC